MEIYSHDEVTDPAYHHMPEAVVFAENAQQVAAVVKLANEYIFPVVHAAQAQVLPAVQCPFTAV